MKKFVLFFILAFLGYNLFAQPITFSWNARHGTIDYISPAEDQKEQGPCGIFTTVAAVEAMVQIYFNTTGSELNLSESNLYSNCGIVDFPVGSALSFIKNIGVVDDYSWRFPTSPVNDPPNQYFRTQCEQFTSYNTKVKIPEWGRSNAPDPTLFISDNQDLKKAIMDHGPIIMMSNGLDQNGYRIGAVLHPGVLNNNVNHTVLLTGWNSTNGLLWEIKDSWPGEISSRRLVDIDFFEYDPFFYCIYPVYNDNGTLKYITCKYENGTNAYTPLEPVDNDHDGFYRWGLDNYPPIGWTGYDKMDFDDSQKSIIFRDGYDPLPGLFISDTTTKYVCGSKEFTLNNFTRLSQLGFTVQWAVTPGNCFNSSTTGTTSIASVVPNTSYIGKKCKIEYQLKFNGNLITTYKFEFYINGPREDLVSISVLDSYGGSAQGSGDFFYLCPNTNYTIYYNNYDEFCTTSSFTWTLPNGWTKNYDYSNYVSINTNDFPYGYLQIYSNTCCGSDKNVKNVYFGGAYCGEYFLIYPNPSSNSVEINTLQSNSSKDGSDVDDLSRDAECLLTVVDKSGMIKSKIEFKGFPYTLDTSKLPDGLYFLNLSWQRKKSTIRLVVKH